MEFTKEGNGFTHISDAAGLARVADTLSAEPAIGRLTRVCERWIYTCLSLALDSEEQTASGFCYQYSVYQLEYSRNLLVSSGWPKGEGLPGVGGPNPRSPGCATDQNHSRTPLPAEDPTPQEASCGMEYRGRETCV